MYFGIVENDRDHLNTKLMKFSCKIVQFVHMEKESFSFKYNKCHLSE